MHEVAASTARSASLQQRLQVVADSGTLAIWEADLVTGEIVWSTRGNHLLGLTPQDDANTMADLLAHLHPDDQPRALSAIEDAVATGATHRLDRFRVVQPDGAIRYLTVHANFVPGTDGSARRMVALAIDVTDLAEKENRLHETEERLRTAYAAAKVWTCRLDLENWVITRPLQADDIGTPQFGPDQSFEEWLERVHPEDRARVESGMRRAIETGELWEDEFRLLWPDGRYHWIYDRGRRIQDPGEPAVFAGAAMDIDERKLVEQQLVENEELRKHQEQALRESERLRRLALSAAHMGAFEWNIVNGDVSWSPEQYQLLQFDPATTTPTIDLFESRVHSEDLPRIRDLMRRLTARREKRYSCELRIVWPDCTVRWIRTLGEFVYDVNGRVIRMFGVNWDVTDQKEAEQQIVQLNRELQRKVADFEALMHAMPVAVAVGLDAESSDIRVNPTFAQMLGVTDSDQNLSQSAPNGAALPFRMVRDGREIPTDELPQQKAARLKQEVRNQEFELITSDDRHVDMFGHAVPILDESGSVRGTLAAYMDITERKRAEKALRTSEKLATAGKMAASLAHEINNPLAAVTNLLYLVAQDASLSPHSQKFIKMATGELARVSQITRNILAFYRESHSPVNTDLADLIASVLELYAPKIRQSNVQVDFRRDGACAIIAFPGELRQVFSNLIVNAVDAMPSGGTLQIRVRRSHNRRSQESGVRLVVADTGSGIPRDHLTHLFEPFFTTKGEKGTGLGLWVSRDIISKHDGTIQIRTASGAGKNGTCFSIFLPTESASVKKRATQKATSVSSNA
jgi:PAS domain S-box-containing protein